MSPAPGAPAAPGPSKNNTLKAPFPRANNTVRPSLSARRPPTATSASSPASKATPTALTEAASNRRTSMPSSGSITGSMGPPPPVGRRNERFDRLFYTSPLPRSISAAYNNLQAASNVTPAATAAATNTAKGATRNITGTAAIVPSALRMGVMIDGASIGGTVTIPHKAPTSTTKIAKAGVPTRNPFQGKATVLGGGGVIPVGIDVREITNDVGVSTLVASNGALMHDLEPQYTKPTTTTTTLAEPIELPLVTANKSAITNKPGHDSATAPTPPKSFAQAWEEEDDAFMEGMSDDAKEWNTSARNEVNLQGKKPDKEIQQEQAATKALVQAIKKNDKRPNLTPSPLTPPTKVQKTTATSSPGQARNLRKSGRKTPATSPATTMGGEKMSTKPRPKEKVTRSFPEGTVEGQKELQEQAKLPRSHRSWAGHGWSQFIDTAPEILLTPSAHQSSPSQPPPAVLLKRSKFTSAVLPGFTVPPGILDETGSLWDSKSGRRVSRRVSVGMQSSGFSSTEKRVNNEYTKVIFGSNTGRRSKEVVRRASVSGPSSFSSSGEGQTKKFTRISLGSKEGVEKEAESPSWRLTSTFGDTRPEKSPKNAPGDAASKKVGTDKTRTSVPMPPALSGPGTPAPRKSKRLSLVGDRENEKLEKMEEHKNTNPPKKKIPLPKFHDKPPAQRQSSPPSPPPPPPLPVKKARRSLRNSIDLSSSTTIDTASVATVASAGGQDQILEKDPPKTSWEVKETPQPTTKNKSGLASSWVVDETPQPEKRLVVEETPQPRKTRRVTRASTRQMIRSKANPEFEFSDEER